MQTAESCRTRKSSNVEKGIRPITASHTDMLRHPQAIIRPEALVRRKRRRKAGADDRLALFFQCRERPVQIEQEFQRVGLGRHSVCLTHRGIEGFLRIVERMVAGQFC